MSNLEIEHIIPLSNGGVDDEENLWLSCGLCNCHKASQIEVFDEEMQIFVKLFNPRRQSWVEHFAWSASGAEMSV